MDPTPRDPSPVRGDRIAELRRVASLTQTELARRSGVSISTVYRAEQGDPALGPQMVARIAAALSVPATEIYVGEVVAVAGQPVTASRAEEQHSEVITRLGVIQDTLDQDR